jgi:hypothetical protein
MGSDPEDPTRPFQGLREVTRSDDSSGNAASLDPFGVRGGVDYLVAVDGFAAQSGSIQLAWDFTPSDNLVPIVFLAEPDRALREGDTLTLRLELDIGNDDDDDGDIKIEWLRDDEDIVSAGSDSPVLVITNFTAANVGSYRARIRSGDVRFFTPSVEIQLNSEGESSSLARDKIQHALESALVGSAGAFQPQASAPAGRRRTIQNSTTANAPIGISRGFNGAQVFTTVYAHRDPEEPLHCGQTGGASYWFAYIPPASGLLSLDTTGSSFDTVLAVYTFTPPLAGYSGLVPVSCDDNAGPNGLTSRLEFTVQRNETYLVAVDGVAGARGTVHLQYQLATAPPPTAPGIIVQAANASVTEGDNASFSVTATGTEPIAFQWRRNGVPIANAAANSLQLASVLLADAGDYDVVLSNIAGSVTSTVAQLTVVQRPIPPFLNSQPAAVSVTEGDPAHFSVSATGTEPLVFQWRHNGVPIANAAANSLQLASVLLADAGDYDVVLSNIAGSVTSTVAQLTVVQRPIPPFLSSQPAAVSVTEGDPAQFSVSAAGTEPLVFQWRHNGVPISNAAANSLQLAGVLLADAGDYDVVLSNIAGSVTSTVAQLTVVPRPVLPSIVVQPTHLTLVEGELAEFSISVTGTEPLAFEWRKDGTPVPIGDSQNLRLPSIASADVGVYSVRVRNAAGSVESQAAVLRIRRPLHLTLGRAQDRYLLSFTASRGWRYLVESRSQMDSSAWTPMGISDGHQELAPVTLALTNPPPEGFSRFYRVRAE